MVRLVGRLRALLPIPGPPRYDPLDPGPPDPPAYTSHARSRSLPALCSLLALALSITISACLALRLSHGAPSSSPERISPTRVLLRTTEDNGAGLGAAIKQQLQRSVILGKLLHAEVFVVESHTSSVFVGGGRHGYDTIGLLNSYRNTAVGVDFTRMCKLSTYLRQREYVAITQTQCDNPMGISLRQKSMLSPMDNCTVILHDLPWESSPGMTRCTWKWLSGALGNPVPRISKEKKTVGLHIRWGDMATNAFTDDPLTPSRSIPIETANDVISTLGTCLGPLDLKVYMELHNETMLADLEHPFTLVDSGSDLADLVDLSRNDILVVAGSGYTTTAHQVSRGGLTVVPDLEMQQERFWDLVGTNSVMKWGEASGGKRDCEAVKKMYESGKSKSGELLKELGLVEEKKGLAVVVASLRTYLGNSGQ